MSDFFNYAQLDMVDKQLSAIHSKIVKKEWTEAYHLLETLSVFMELASLDWPSEYLHTRCVLPGNNHDIEL